VAFSVLNADVLTHNSILTALALADSHSDIFILPFYHYCKFSMCAIACHCSCVYKLRLCILLANYLVISPILVEVYCTKIE